MFELVGLIGLIFVVGLVLLAAWIVLLPFYLLFRLLGFAIKVGFAGIFVAFFGILLLPLVVVVGALFFLKFLLFGIPLLIAFALFSWLAGFFRRDRPTYIVTQSVPPASS